MLQANLSWGTPTVMTDIHLNFVEFCILRCFLSDFNQST